MRNLVICCDGTWNTLDNKDGDIHAPTNVARIFGAAPDILDAEHQQLSYYHEGVGTEGGFLSRIRGGGLGSGLNKNIKSSYKWLSVNYKPDDQIFLFGFSRGAYTVRSLAGMINASGLLNLSDENLEIETIWKRVDEAFARYKGHRQRSASFSNAKFHPTPNIHFMGVWDTVGSLGIPDDLGVLNLFDMPHKYKFHDTVLSSKVVHARHAVAIDEFRQSFAPTLWSNIPKDHDVEQIWFSGVHSDVGGGYADTALADLSFAWMMDEAKKHGLQVREGLTKQLKGDPLGLLHDSLTGVFEKLKTRPRNVPSFDDAKKHKLFHKSAISRQKNPPLSQPNYWRTRQLNGKESIKLDIFANRPWNSTGVFLRAGIKYEFAASGQWLDASIKSTPAGTNGSSSFQIGEVIHLASTGFGQLEKLFKRITKNTHADFTFTRREETMPWFSLVGVIANGKGVNLKDQSPEKHDTFLIGDGTVFTPSKDGYLYCYANDAWQTYKNNKGSVELMIKQLSDE